MAAALEDDQSAFGAAREADKAGRKEWRAQQRDALDEMLPKATGRHACFDTSPQSHYGAGQRTSIVRQRPCIIPY